MTWEVLCKCSGKYIDIYFNLKITCVCFLSFTILSFLCRCGSFGPCVFFGPLTLPYLLYTVYNVDNLIIRTRASLGSLDNWAATKCDIYYIYTLYIIYTAGLDRHYIRC